MPSPLELELARVGSVTNEATRLVFFHNSLTPLSHYAKLSLTTMINVIFFVSNLGKGTIKKSRIRETKNLSTDADRRTDTILERLRDLFKKKIYIYIYY